MINKDTAILKLSELKSKGIDTSSEIRKVLSLRTVPISTIKVIKGSFSIESYNFYKHLKMNYYNNKSPLYKNIMKSDNTPIITLSSLQLQILLWGKKLEDPITFYEETRLNEITACINKYSKTFDNITEVLNVLEKIKDDILILENI